MDRRRGIARALLRLAPLTVTGFMQISWFGNLALATDPHANARRDWYRFYQTGRQLLAGDLTAIYRMASDSRYFWLYPPYCIYLAAPLGVLPEWYAYALCVLVEVAAVGGALAVLRAAVPGRGADHTNAAIAVLASMPFNTAIVIGQISGVLSLILAASLWAWRRRRPVTTGLLLSLLFIKPNLAVFFLAAVTFSVIITWVYNHTGGSILAVAIWHAAYNLSSATTAADGTIAALSSTLVIVWAVSIIQRERAGIPALGR